MAHRLFLVGSNLRGWSVEDVEGFDLSFFEEGGEYAANYNVDILPAGLTNYLLCNCSENSVCSDPVLREAIYYAIDAQSIVNGVANGMGIVTHDGSNATLQDYISLMPMKI